MVKNAIKYGLLVAFMMFIFIKYIARITIPCIEWCLLFINSHWILSACVFAFIIVAIVYYTIKNDPTIHNYKGNER